MKYVVVGGAGFIGSNLAHLLCDEGHQVEVVDTLVSGKKENLPAGVTLHTVDARNTNELVPIFRDADAVFHLVALPSVQYSIEHPEETNETNVGSTVSILNAARTAGVKRVVYSASAAAYGDQQTLPLTEDMPALPKSPYGLHKYIGELYMKLWHEVYGIETVCLRYFNVYGPRLNPEGPYASAIGHFIKQKKDNQPLTVTGDGEQTRDYVHVSDVARANLLAATSDKVGKGEVINIGNGIQTTINTLAHLFGGEVEHIAQRIEPKHSRADVTKAKMLLGWEGEVFIEEGIKDLKKLWGIE